MEMQRMICAVDHFQHYSPYAPSFMVPPQLPHNFDLPPMHTSYSPPSRASPTGESFFPVSSMSASSRRRTAQACDKCRERKTKVSLLSEAHPCPLFQSVAQCSGEKPVCQRCANRGLLCEYTCREPRTRGPSRTRLMSTSTPPIAARDEKFLLPSLARSNFSRSYPTIIPAGCTVSGSAPKSVTAKHPNSLSPYLGAETRTYSESRNIHYPHWEDVQLRPSVLPSDYSASQLRMTPHDTMRMEYDPYRSSKHMQKRHNSLSDGVLSSTSSFVSKAHDQENPRYNNSNHSSLYALSFSFFRGSHRYNYSTSHDHLAQSSLSASSDSNSPCYHSNSALSSATPTPPFYSQETLQDAATPEAYGRPVMSDYHDDTVGKRIYQNDGLIPLKLPYVNKDAEIQEGWSMSRHLRSDYMWSVDVDLNACRLDTEKGVQ